MPDVYHPRSDPQLGRGVPVPGKTRGSMDCGPRTVRRLIAHQTKGQFVPTVEEVRQRMGKPGPVPTSTADAERCVDSYDAEMAKFDRRPLRYDRFRGDIFLPMLDDHVMGGGAAQVAIDYGVLNRALDFKTGDPNFVGTPAKPAGHSIMVSGWRRVRVKRGKQKRSAWTVLWYMHDSLDDGRREGIPDPEHGRWVRRGAIVRAWRALGHYFGLMRGGERTL